MRPIAAMVRKDLLLFFGDRRALIISFAVPILIASFFGALFKGSAANGPAKTRVAVIDHDGSVISKAIVKSASADQLLDVIDPGEDSARLLVRKGRLPVAVIIPAGFGQAAGDALFGIGAKPDLELLYDPSRSMELAMIRGVLTQHVIQAVSKEMFGGPQGKALVEQALPQLDSIQGVEDEQRAALRRMLQSVQGYYAAGAADSGGATITPGITMPYEVTAEAVTSGGEVKYNSYAHSFAGMAVQFLLFAMTSLGIDMLLERQRGLWKRFRAAPVSKIALLAGKGISGALIALMTLWVSFAFAIIVFHVRIEGSVAGFIGVSIATALMASTFGLLVAALGNSPAAARGVTTLAVLMMVMLGGAWVPAFVFPAWLQEATKVVPVRWALDGLDGTTWRGLGLEAAMLPILVLLGFATLFGSVALARFKWEEKA